MFAVVQDEQQPPGPERVDEPIGRPCRVADLERRHHHVHGPAGRPRLQPAQLGQPDAVREVVEQAARGLQRQPRLAHPARADRGHGLVPADQLGERGGQVSTWPCRGRRGRGGERGILGEHGPVQGHQVGAGVEAELICQAHPELLEGAQRLARPPGPV